MVVVIKIWTTKTGQRFSTLRVNSYFSSTARYFVSLASCDNAVGWWRHCRNVFSVDVSSFVLRVSDAVILSVEVSGIGGGRDRL